MYVVCVHFDVCSLTVKREKLAFCDTHVCRHRRILSEARGGNQGRHCFAGGIASPKILGVC